MKNTFLHIDVTDSEDEASGYLRFLCSSVSRLPPWRIQTVQTHIFCEFWTPDFSMGRESGCEVQPLGSLDQDGQYASPSLRRSPSAPSRLAMLGALGGLGDLADGHGPWAMGHGQHHPYFLEGSPRVNIQKDVENRNGFATSNVYRRGNHPFLANLGMVYGIRFTT